MKRVRAGLVLAAALLFAAPAPAQMAEVPFGKWWKRPRIVEMLHLSSDQQQRLEEIFTKNRRNFIDLRAEVERRSLDVEDLMARKDADAKKIGTAVEALEEAKGRLGRARTMMIVEMRGVLSAEQWQTVLDRREQWRGEREEGKRRRLGPGAGKENPRERPDAD